MATLSLQLHGKKRVTTNIRAEVDNLLTKSIGGLVVVAGQEMTEMKRRAPVDTGDLQSSGFVDGPNFLRIGGFKVVEMVFSFGDTVVTYAFAVHEDLEAFHNPGQARYVASVLEESSGFLTPRIAAAAGLG